MDEHSVMFLAKFSFFLVLFVLCQPDPGSRSRCSAQMTDDNTPSLDDHEANALSTVLYSLGSTISSSFCDDQPYLNSINITCSNTSGTDNKLHVIGITMMNQRLNGYIHPNITNLTYLETLDLSYNQLHDSIPSNLGGLSHLTTLDLSSNQLTGRIPSSLGNLKNLSQLDLSSNQLIGSMPPSLGNLKNLTQLYLELNFLTGTIPPSLGDLSSLEEIDLSCNKLSGAIPRKLGELSQLQILYLDDNELNGTLPEQLGNLTNLRELWVTSNYLTGKVPEDYKNLTNLEAFAVGGNYMSGPIPPFIANWTNLNRLILLGNNFMGVLPPKIFYMTSLEILRVSDLKSNSFAFPNSSNLTRIETLVLRNCNITGEIRSYIGNWSSSLRNLDLSFNNLKGGIPDSFKNLSLETMLLTGNKLSGQIPDWINDTIIEMGDFSYNDFEEQGKNVGPKINREPSTNDTEPSTNDRTLPKILDDHCNGTKSQYHSLFINAGGEDVNNDGKHYDADNKSSNTFYISPTKRWASVCSGEFFSTTANSSDYIRSTCEASFPEPALYDKARVCPQSLTYYGLCFKNGKYNVTLHFAEIVFSKDEDHSSNGKRVFDVSIQGARVLEDFNIKKEAKGLNNTCTKSFPATVDNHLLEIRLFWAGKGSLYNPPALNGPLISAISVTPDFKIGVLSTKLIVGIVIAVVSALVLASLLLWAFMWRMGWVGDRELNNTTVKIREKEYSLKEVIVATGNFGPQNEIGQMVYMAKLRDQEKPVAVKKLSLYTKQFDQITNEVYAGQKLKHDNLVELLAVCSNKKRKIFLIIYDYMANGSLQQALFDDPNVQGQLNWERRVEICRGIAKGLEYLHELATGKIIHRNIKASKVLLDEDFNAKLSDLGLAMLYDEDEPHDFLQKIAAAVTYMAPEVLKKESVTDKADVFSYGIVLLEIISGQSNSKHEGKEERESLLQRAAVLHKKGSYSELVDQKLTSCDMQQFIRIFDLAMRCVDQTPDFRPKMSDVVTELEEI